MTTAMLTCREYARNIVVLILLPPSEGKTAPERGAPLDWTRLWLPELTTTRQRLVDALIRLCSGDPDTAADVLKLGPAARADIAKNVEILSAATTSSIDVYTGVLYEALGAATLEPAARERLSSTVAIFSGLWGAVRPDDPIPAYRCSAGIQLALSGDERTSAAGTHWRAALRDVFDPIGHEQFVLDLRSGPYRSMWRPSGKHATIRVLSERVIGGETKRTVVSHFNKATKGRIVRDVLTSGVDCGDRAELASLLDGLGYRVDDVSSHPDELDVVIPG